jgi:hypothetical protein
MALALTPSAVAQTCTGLCTQQVSCPNGGTTTISGTIYAPNGTDPLPNVLVYIPNAPVAAFTPGVSCPALGEQPSGSPLVGTVTAVDGTFTLANVPVGQNIPLVIKLGRWRRQVVVPSTTPCAATYFSTRLPRNHTEGDIPKIAIVTSSTDQVECVVRAVGIDDAEFTSGNTSGRINLYLGDTYPGAHLGAFTPTETSLMSDSSTLNQYDILMLPSQGIFSPPNVPSTSLDNLANFVDAGGRAYLSHLEYPYIEDNQSLLSPGENYPLSITWEQTLQPNIDAAPANINQYLDEAEVMANWLQLTHVITTLGQVPYPSTPQDIFSILSPAQNWLEKSNAGEGAGILQTVSHTPETATNQCGRVVFDDYDIEHPAVTVALPNITFPAECKSGFQSPQESVFEYSLFELSPDQEASLVPAFADFGSEDVGYATAPQSFTWTNNSPDTVTAYPSTGSADFPVVSSNCSSVPANGTCQVQVEFMPTAIGYRTAYLTVASTGLLSAAKAYLSGTGIPDLAIAVSNLQFGSRDVGDPLTQSTTVTNPKQIAIAFPPISTTGDYTATTTCGSTIPPSSTCTISVTFDPTAIGPRQGTLLTGTNPPILLNGNGIDFSLSTSPSSGSQTSGKPITVHLITTPLGGYIGSLTQTCTTDAPATTCSTATVMLTGQVPTPTQVTVTTTPTYIPPTSAGLSGRGSLWLLSLVACSFSFLRRRSARILFSTTAHILLITMITLTISACGASKYYVLNPSGTPAGTYTVTLTETDGFLVHTTSYSLSVLK